MLDLDAQLVGQVGELLARRSSSGPQCGTQRILSSWPLSSDMRKTATAVTAIRQPEKVGSDTQTIASSGSPSSPSVSVTKP